MKVQKRYARNVIVVLLLALALIAFALYYYNSRLTQRLSKNMEATMSELADSQQHGMNMEFNAQLRTIELIASAVETRAQDGSTDEEYLKEIVSHTNFDYLALWSKGGYGQDSTGQIVNIADRAYYDRVIHGETVLSEPIVSRVDGRRMISLVTPIYKDGEVSSILMGMYTFEQFNSMLATTFSGRGYAFIVDAKGEMIARTENYTITDNLRTFEIWKGVEFQKGFSLENIMRDISEGREGNSVYSNGGVRRLIEYRPLDQNGWMLALVVPAQVIGSEAAAISHEATLLTLLVIGCAAFGLGYIVLQRRSRDKERQSHVVELEQIAYYDALTNLPNLYKFRVITQLALENKLQKSCIILKLDILRFKVINDLFGFELGNRVLLAVAEILREGCLESERSELRCIARAGADEFLLFDTCSLAPAEIDAALQSFEESVSVTLAALLGNHKLSFRYGVYLLEPEQEVLDEAVEKANLAHREAKQSTSRNICYYNDEIRARVLREAELQNNMESALHEGQFQVYLQPKYDLRDERAAGAEALVRWQEPSGNMVFPNDFIPIFEKNGFIVELDIHVFKSVCALLRSWLDEGLEPVRVSVNFSRLHLGKEHFVEGLVEIADSFDVPHHYIEIELTENIIFENEVVLLHLLEELHRADFTLSMDDFGTGYSSLGLLKNLPVDVIKIDRSFFSASSQRMRTKAVLRSVVDMAKSLDIYTVAEGVETEDQVALLREIGCELVQGYYFARPMPAAQFTTILRETNQHTAMMY